MQLRKVFPLLLSLLIFATSWNINAFSDPGDDNNSSDTESLKVLSWNIYMLPAFASLSKQIGKTHRVARANAIVEAVKQEDYDIIVWQETFHVFSRRALKKGLKELYPYQYGPANNGLLSWRFNSGVAIFSKFPLTKLKEIKYKRCKGIDCWVRKGALMMEGEFNGEEFQILGTHLQADGDDEIRLEQCEHIRNSLLIPHEKEGVPQIICGDMNINSNNEDSYGKMKDFYEVEGYNLDGNPKTHPEGEIDYIFVRKNGGKMKIQRKMTVLKQMWYKGKSWLSDHNGIEAIISFKKQAMKKDSAIPKE